MNIRVRIEQAEKLSCCKAAQLSCNAELENEEEKMKLELTT